jgi:hypothetical protein
MVRRSETIDGYSTTVLETVEFESTECGPSLGEQQETLSYARDNDTDRTFVTDRDGGRPGDCRSRSGTRPSQGTSGRGPGSNAASTDYESPNLEEYCATSISLSGHLHAQLANRQRQSNLRRARHLTPVPFDG